MEEGFKKYIATRNLSFYGTILRIGFEMYLSEKPIARGLSAGELLRRRGLVKEAVQVEPPGEDKPEEKKVKGSKHE